MGTTIIIDVFRAFTTAAIAFDHGAKEITLVAEPEEALELHRRGIGDFLMGEVAGTRPEGFNFGNSPYEISQVDLAGKTLVQSTRAGHGGRCGGRERLGDLLGVFRGGSGDGGCHQG